MRETMYEEGRFFSGRSRPLVYYALRVSVCEDAAWKSIVGELRSRIQSG